MINGLLAAKHRELDAEQQSSQNQEDILNGIIKELRSELEKRPVIALDRETESKDRTHKFLEI